MTDAERALLAHLCAEYDKRHIDRRQFSEAVWALVSVWDCISASILFAQVEATAREHFCEWWADCDNVCDYRQHRDKRPPWQDGWATLGWKTQASLVTEKTDKITSMRSKDARSVVTGTLRAKIFARDKHRCVKCGAKPPLQVDHIIPVSRGGSGEPSNLQSLCAPCNRRKGITIEADVGTMELVQ